MRRTMLFLLTAVCLSPLQTRVVKSTRADTPIQLCSCAVIFNCIRRSAKRAAFGKSVIARSNQAECPTVRTVSFGTMHWRAARCRTPAPNHHSVIGKQIRWPCSIR